MSDIVERMREAHPNSAQRFAGSNILLDAADEIARLRSELASARAAAFEEAIAAVEAVSRRALIDGYDYYYVGAEPDGDLLGREDVLEAIRARAQEET